MQWKKVLRFSEKMRSCIYPANLTNPLAKISYLTSVAASLTRADSMLNETEQREAEKLLLCNGRSSDQKIEEPFSIKIEYGKPFTLKTPEGEISAAGKREINLYLSNNILPHPDDDNFEWVWQNKRGTLPKRLQSYFYKTHNLKLSPSQISELGNLGRRHSDDSKEFILDFDNKIQWWAGDFGDSGSCYWGTCSGAKDMLRDNGACAVRSFYRKYDPQTGKQFEGLDYAHLKGNARAWVAPITENRIIVFNGYGLTTLQFARLLALKFNCTYKKISLTNNGCDDGLLYINCDGIVVGQWAQIENLSEWDFGWYEPDKDNMVQCDCCECDVHEDDAIQAYTELGSTRNVCSDCAWNCENCGSYFSYHLTQRNGAWLCNDCAQAHDETERIVNETAEIEREEIKNEINF